MEERELLAAFISGDSGEAFGELVRRNADLVYSSARRQLGDATLAEDVTQAVFILLARKANSVRGPLPGWLLKTTYYACKDARKLANRRLIHERRAAEMRAAQAGGEADWDEYAPMLDQAMARLGGKERAAVALRFLRGKSLKEVGVELGVSEKAAEKRVNRAVARLRKLISLKSAPPAVAVLAADLAAKGTQAAPASMVSAIVAGGANAAAGSLASAIALHTASMLIRSKAIAMGLMLIVLLSAATVVVVAQVSERKTAAPPQPAQVPLPVATVQPAEGQVPGDVQLARWEVLLDETGAKIVMEAAQPVQSGGVFYQAFIGDGAELRATAAQANSTGHLISTGSGIRIATDRRGNAALKQDELAFSQFEPFYFDYADSPKPHVYSTGQPSHSEQTFTRLNNGGLHLVINHTNLPVQLRDASNVARAKQSASLVYTGDLAAGQALVWMGRFLWQGNAYYHLCVFETFKAQAEDMFTVRNEGNITWWVNNGPDKLRHWAVAARAWAARGEAVEINGPPAEPWAMVRTRSDGEKVWLEALSRPAMWPSCWWDVLGKPSPQTGYISFAGDPPGGLWGMVILEGTNRDWGMLDGGGLPRPSDSQPVQKVNFQDVFQLRDGEKQFDIGTPIGKWEEFARLDFEGDKVVEGIDCRTKPMLGEPQNVDLILIGKMDDEFQLLIVGRDGKETNDPSNFGEHWTKIGRDVQPRKWEHMFYIGKREDAAYLKLMRRKREFVTFEGYAINPVAPPKADVTAAEADDAQAKQRLLTAAAQLQILQTQRSELLSQSADATTAMGALRQIAAAIGAGDAAVLHKRIKPDALSMEAGEQFIQSLLAAGTCRKQLIALYGETKVQAELPQLPDFGMMLMILNWKKADDGSLSFGGDESDSQTISKEADGEFYLHLHLVSTPMRQATQKSLETYRKLDTLLKATPPPTLEQAKAALAAAPGL